MTDCVRLPKCPFFHDRMASVPTSAELMKMRYCRDDHTCCARFQVAASGREVPADLFPNQHYRIGELLRG